MITYRSFVEAVETLDDAEQGAAWRVLHHYALDGELPQADVSQSVRALFIAFKAMIDVNNRRYENGCRGGRKNNQTATKPKPNPNQTATKPKPNDNVNDNVNVNDNGERENLSHSLSRKTDDLFLELQEEILGNTTTSQNFQRMYKLTKGEVCRYLDQFQRKLQLDGMTTKTRTDYRSHFNSWLAKEIKQGRQHLSETEKIIGNANTFTSDTAGTGDVE